MKLSIRSRRVKALAITGALVAAALPFAAGTPAGAAPLSPTLTCAGSFAGGTTNPDDNLPSGIIPLTTGYTATGPVLKGGDKIVNDVNNSAAKGVRFSANLTIGASPAFDQIFAPATNVGTGFIKVSWKNGAIKAAKPGDLSYPFSGVPEYKVPAIQIGESQKISDVPFKKITVAKGVGVGVPASGTSIFSNVPPAGIVQELNTGIYALSWVVAYKGTYFPTQQALVAIWGYADADLTTQPLFVSQGNAALLALNPAYVDVDPNTDEDAACTTLGLIYVACVNAPTLLPPSVAGLCATIV
jgi:hypothetical protein